MAIRPVTEQENFMICFDITTNSFLLEGKNYSYAMYVNRTGLLQQLYYGTKISKSDLAFLIQSHGKAAEPNPDDWNKEQATDYMPAECGTFGHGDFRPAAVIARRVDGASMSRLKYAGHKISKGALQLKGMPCIRMADETLTITLKDDFSDMEVDLHYSVSKSSDVLVRNLTIRNTGTDVMNLERAYSFSLDLPDLGDFHALRLPGAWGRERKPAVTKLLDGVLTVASTVGYSSHKMNPFLGILVNDCGENSGECYGFNVIYSGNFVLHADSCSHQSLRICGGIHDHSFGWKLNAGEAFETPQVAMCYSSDGLGAMSRAYHDFFRAFIIDPKWVNARRPIVVNNWEATYMDFDNEKLFAIIDEAAGTGIDTFVLDDGWFGARNSDNCALGDWFVNEEKLKGGLKAVIDRCRQNGLKFGLWFEPEMISEDSDLYRAHPDWAIRKEGVEPVRMRNQLVLDFTRKDVVNYMFNVISKILNENDISYVKWDKNREITENFSASLPADRQGEFLHRYTLGFYDLADRLTKAFPEIFFEGCAGGGGRFDGGALYYFPQIWTSDDTDALERTKIQWGTSICYPLSTMSCHVSACPNHQTWRTTPFATRGAIASLGATGYELDLSKLTDEEKQQVKLQIDNYKGIDDLILDGELYRLSDPCSANYFCEMVVAKDKSRAYLVGEQFRADPNDHNRVLKLQGLDENKVYTIREMGISASGSALMGAGLLYPKLHDCESWIWHLEEK